MFPCGRASPKSFNEFLLSIAIVIKTESSGQNHGWRLSLVSTRDPDVIFPICFVLYNKLNNLISMSIFFTWCRDLIEEDFFWWKNRQENAEYMTRIFDFCGNRNRQQKFIEWCRGGPGPSEHTNIDTKYDISYIMKTNPKNDEKIGLENTRKYNLLYNLKIDTHASEMMQQIFQT